MGFAEQNQRNGGLGYAKPFGYFGLRHGATQHSDFGDFFCSQKLLEETNAADVNGVTLVFGVIHPFKIGDDAVSLDAIKMIDHREMVRVGNEGQSNQSVNVDRFAAAISEKIDVSVAEFIRAGSKNFAVYSAGLQPIANSVQASHSAEIANLVEISEVVDRNRSPFFCESDIHQVGRPSGTSGLMVKDPPRAPTFGGSAFMAWHSEGCNPTLQ